VQTVLSCEDEKARGYAPLTPLRKDLPSIEGSVVSPQPPVSPSGMVRASCNKNSIFLKSGPLYLSGGSPNIVLEQVGYT
jgi:hypothetical protein